MWLLVTASLLLGAVPSGADAASCENFRPDRRYGDQVEQLRTERTSCRFARRVLRRFYDYDRDGGRYRPATYAGMRCRHRARADNPMVFDGRCRGDGRSVRWVFGVYTG